MTTLSSLAFTNDFGLNNIRLRLSTSATNRFDKNHALLITFSRRWDMWTSSCKISVDTAANWLLNVCQKLEKRELRGPTQHRCACAGAWLLLCRTGSRQGGRGRVPTHSIRWKIVFFKTRSKTDYLKLIAWDSLAIRFVEYALKKVCMMLWFQVEFLIWLPILLSTSNHCLYSQ